MRAQTKTLKLVIFFCIAQYTVQAQNIFPSSGRAGINTTSPATSLQVVGGARIGRTTNYVNIDSATGNLSFAGTANYLVQDNAYAFRSASNSGIGLFFNRALLQYEFRNTSANPVLSINATTGNGIFTGGLQIGNSTNNNAGNIRWTGTDFQGYNGTAWTSLTTGTGANTSLSNLTAATAINNDLLPNANNNINLGSSSLRWKDLNLYNVKFADGTMQSTAFAPYAAGTGIGISGNIITNTSPDQNVAINAGTGISINGNYPNFTVNSTVKGSQWKDTGTTGNMIFFNGNVGIGDVNPTLAPLVVNGDAIINGVTVGTGPVSYSYAHNTVLGAYALSSNITGGYNTAVGEDALGSNINGNYNTALGMGNLFANTTGNYNTAVGTFSLIANTTGSGNTALGASTFYFGNSSYNTALGSFALDVNVSGDNNTAVGSGALFYNDSGYNNVAVGGATLAYSFFSSNNTYVGNYADKNGNYNNSGAFGYGVTISSSNQFRIGNSSATSIGGYTNWTNVSDGRIKKNVKENVPGLAFINKLKPVTYNLDLDAADKIIERPEIKLDSKYTGKPDFKNKAFTDAVEAKQKVVYTGFVAQDVEKAAKELNFDFSGVDAAKNEKDLYGLRYAEFVVPLVKAVQELSQQNDEMRKEIDELKKIISPDKVSAAGNNQNSTQVIEISAKPVLEQNVPNPFSGATTINCFLPVNNGNAYLNFYDQAGRLLQSSKLTGIGKNTITLKTTELAASIYRYTLVVDGRNIDSKQMILIK